MPSCSPLLLTSPSSIVSWPTLSKSKNVIEVLYQYPPPSPPPVAVSRMPFARTKVSEQAKKITPRREQQPAEEDGREWWDDDDKFNPFYHPGPPPPPSVATFDVILRNCPGQSRSLLTGKDVYTGRVYSIRVVDTATPSSMHEAIAEVKAYKRMAETPMSPFIMEALTTFRNSSNLHIVMPFMSGNLQAQIGRPESVTKHVLQTAIGLSALHSMGIVHCDIRPSNLLLTPRGDVRITGFGSSYVHNKYPLRRGALTLRMPRGMAPYLSPEVFSGDQYDHMVDFWALGVTMFELLRGRLPFSTSQDLTQYCKDEVAGDNSYWMAEAGMDLTEAEVVGGLLHTDPGLRWDYQDLRESPYFDDVATRTSCSPDSVVKQFAFKANSPVQDPLCSTGREREYSLRALQQLTPAEQRTHCLNAVEDLNWTNPWGPWAVQS
ncbi:kinase-like protein [Artomyces pyxidatus]|uniref:Kinase-like protein n=1 Tax=Artomyces pyxidatus TaxID=48021 RepID=A0ACB8SQ50_9AGAM|nr:kinase-like protein [Artomyces pyxidatus]